MAISEREHHIKTLENLLKETKGKIELYSENKNIDLTKEKEIEETLAYAISSLKTDLKYDLMYLVEDVYTKADIVAILKEIQDKIFKESWRLECIWDDLDGSAVDLDDINKIIQQKINELKENTDKKTMIDDDYKRFCLKCGWNDSDYGCTSPSGEEIWQCPMYIHYHPAEVEKFYEDMNKRKN